MAKFSIITPKGAPYIRAWLKYMMREYKIEVAEPENSDIILISISDLNEISYIKKAKEYKKPIIMGGCESFNDLLYGNLVDLINIGEGFDFFIALGKIKTLPAENIIDKLKELPFIYYKGKKEVVPSYFVDWRKVPIVKTGEKRRIVLGARGCKRKCKFCYTSWTTKYQHNPYFNNIDKEVMIISNDNATPEELNQRAYVRSITAQDYIKLNQKQVKNCYYYRIGLESFSEKQRKYYGKPISNEEVREIFWLSKQRKHKISFFIIGGIEPQESIVEFLETNGTDYCVNPKVEIKVTYFNPCLHTPLENYDIRELKLWNQNWLRGRLVTYSTRYRTNILKNNNNAFWRTFIKRCRNEEQINEVWKWKNKTKEYMLFEIERRQWQHMFNQANPSAINFKEAVKL